jgi:hypothetical protein
MIKLITVVKSTARMKRESVVRPSWLAVIPAMDITGKKIILPVSMKIVLPKMNKRLWVTTLTLIAQSAMFKAWEKNRLSN